MTTYTWLNGGAGMPARERFSAPFQARISVPEIIAGGAKGGLADTDGNAIALPSTGFGANDILQVFEVPKGFVLTSMGVNVFTAEGGACTADIGNASTTQTHLGVADANGYMDTIDLNSAVPQIVLVADAQLGCNNNMGVWFITDGTIDFTFITAATAVTEFDVWANGFFVNMSTT